MTFKRSNVQTLIPVALTGIGIVLIHRPLAPHLFSVPFSSYDLRGLGPIAPILAVVLAWLRRGRLKTLPSQPDGKGLWLIIAGGLFAFVGYRLEMHFPVAISLALMLAGSLWWLWGRRWVEELWFPLLLLVGITAFPDELTTPVAFKLQTLVARFVATLLGLVRLPVERAGVTLTIEEHGVQVAEACSGWSAFSVAAWLFLIALYMQPPDRWWRSLLSLPLLLPLAVLANIFRVLTVVIGSVHGQSWVLKTPWHELVGLLYFVVPAWLIFLHMARWQPMRAAIVPSHQVSNSPNSASFDKLRMFDKLRVPVSRLWWLMGILWLLWGGLTLADWQGKMASSSTRVTPLDVPSRLGAWRLANHHVEEHPFRGWYVQALYRHSSERKTARAFLHLPLTSEGRLDPQLKRWLGLGYELMSVQTLTITIRSSHRRIPVEVAILVKDEEQLFLAVTYLHRHQGGSSRLQAKVWRMAQKLIYGACEPWLMVSVVGCDPKAVLEVESLLITRAERWIRNYRREH